MIKRMGFKVVDEPAPITYVTLFPNNLEKMREKYPKLLSDKNIKNATERFGSKKENLVVVELPVNREQRRVFRKLSFKILGKLFEIKQVSAALMDGASTPVNIGDIGSFTPNLLRAWFIHDILYAIFHDIKRKLADRIFTCFAEKDGTNRLARIIMMLSLRLFGGKARDVKPCEHWNYGRFELKVNGIRIYK